MARPRTVVLGHCTPDSVRIHVSADAGLTQAFVAYQAAGEPPALQVGALSRAEPYCVGLVELNGLPAGARVRYAVEVLREGESAPTAADLLQSGAAREFRLLPADTRRPLRIGLLSCNNLTEVPEARRYALWQRLGDEVEAGRVDLLIHAGDQVYADPIYKAHAVRKGAAPLSPSGADAVAALAAEYRHLYVHAWEQPAIARVLGSVPSVMMWDDHDIYDGYGSNEDDLEPSAQAFFRAAAAAFAEFQAPLNPPLADSLLRCSDGRVVPRGDSFVTAFATHGVGVLLLDGRSRRNYRAGVICGENQWAVVENVFKSWEADKHLKRVFVVVGVPVVHAEVAAALSLIELSGLLHEAADDLRDSWVARNNREECRRLLMRLFTFKEARPEVEVTLLGGDAHVSTLARIHSSLHQAPGQKAPEVYQVTSSGIGHPVPGGLELLAIRNGTKAPSIELVGGGLIRGSLLPISGSRDSRLLLARNFAVLRLGPEEGTAWGEDNNLEVVFHAEGYDKPLTTTLLTSKPVVAAAS